MNIGERFAKLRAMQNKTVSEAARAIGISRQAVYQFESGQTKDLQSANLMAAAKFVGLTVEQLLCGHAAEPDPGIAAAKYAFIRRYQVSAGAGHAVHPDHEEISGTHAFRRDWLAKRGLNAGGCVVIDVDGDSMDPTICDGDTVLVNTEDKKLVSGRVYAFRTDEGARIKRLHKQLDGRVLVSSDNPNKSLYRDEYLTPGMEAEIIGVVVHRSGPL